MYGRKSRIIKGTAAIIAVLCLAVGIMALFAGAVAVIIGSVAEMKTAGGLIGDIYILSVYFTPLGFVLGVFSYFLSRCGMRCGSLEKSVGNLALVSSAACLVAFITWMIII